MADTNFTALLESVVNEPGRIHAAYTAFHNYSLGNQLLAMGQCMAREIPIGPIATFQGWKDKGRFVKKGEKAIELCMPVTVKRTNTDESGDETESTFTRFIYRRNWFVLSQTDGAEYQPASVGDWDESRALATLDVTRIEFDMTDGNCQGYARARSVAVSPVAAHPFKTLIHELAHVALGHTLESEMADSDRTPRDIRELEAECVAMLVCAALNQPGVEYCRGYVQHWFKGDEVPETSARKILKTADQILKAGRQESEAA